MTWDPDDTRTFAPFAPSSALIIGAHNIFVRNGVTLNDRTQLECIWVEETTGFESPDVRISSQENVQEDGSLPDPGFYGERTMTFNGWIQAGTYPQVLNISRVLLDCLIGLKEVPLLITTQPESVFEMPDVTINCRPAGRPSLATKIEASDRTGVFKRAFSFSLVASTNPFLIATAVKSDTLTPSVVSQFGRVYPRIYDLVYETPIDGTGTPTAGTGANTITLVNEGNWQSKPIIRFNGGVSDIILINMTNGQMLTINGSIANGDYYELNVEAGTIVNSLGQNMAEFLDTASDWMVLEGQHDGYDGTNVIVASVGSYDGAASIQFIYSDTSA